MQGLKIYAFVIPTTSPGSLSPLSNSSSSSEEITIALLLEAARSAALLDAVEDAELATDCLKFSLIEKEHYEDVRLVVTSFVVAIL